MTIMEAISQADDLNRNAYSQQQKLVWLSRCEAQAAQVVREHEGGENYGFEEFSEKTDPRTKLIMPQPYDEGYVHWLAAQINYANKEYNDYNAAMSMFNTAMDGFRSWWKEQHVPIGLRRFRF